MGPLTRHTLHGSGKEVARALGSSSTVRGSSAHRRGQRGRGSPLVSQMLHGDSEVARALDSEVARVLGSSSTVGGSTVACRRAAKAGAGIELHAPTNSTQKLKLMRKGGQFLQHSPHV
jgi:hypothetical protein